MHEVFQPRRTPGYADQPLWLSMLLVRLPHSYNFDKATVTGET